MDYFNLPASTVVQRVVPKNSFDAFTNSKQKELFTHDIAKITWSNSLSTKTINLPTKDILEIQLFVVELKKQKDIKGVLDIIDKSIPYHIIFVVEYGDYIYLSASSKHPSPLNEARSVIDWTFKSDWMKKAENKYEVKLRKSIDNVFYEFCEQLSLKPNAGMNSLSELMEYNSTVDALLKEIGKLKRSIASCQHFNKKVELNLRLKELEREVDNL